MVDVLERTVYFERRWYKASVKEVYNFAGFAIELQIDSKVIKVPHRTNGGSSE